MSLPSYAVKFRGRYACPCQVIWIPAFEKEAQRRGWLEGEQTIYQMIGGSPLSAGTHTKGGADDTAYVSDRLIWLSRQMGADATWHRPYNWDGHDSGEHVHRVLRGCPHNEPARYQIAAVDAGYNGLGHLGEGGRDTGPRPLSKRTWREGIAWAKRQAEKDDDLMAFSDWSNDDKQAFGEFIQDQVRKTVIPDVPQQDGTKADQHLGSLLKGLTQNIIDIEKAG